MAHHDVKDTKHWLASPKREEIFGPMGVTNIRTFVDPQKPNRVGLVMDVADMDRLVGFMTTKPAVDAMEHDGVLPETVVFLVQSQRARRSETHARSIPSRVRNSKLLRDTSTGRAPNRCRKVRFPPFLRRPRMGAKR